MSDLTAEQHQTVEDRQAKAMANSEELLKLSKQFTDGEIDQDELFRRQSELMGEG